MEVDASDHSILLGLTRCMTIDSKSYTALLYSKQILQPNSSLSQLYPGMFCWSLGPRTRFTSQAYDLFITLYSEYSQVTSFSMFFAQLIQHVSLQCTNTTPLSSVGIASIKRFRDCCISSAPTCRVAVGP